MDNKLIDFFKSYQEADELLEVRMASVKQHTDSISTGSYALDNALSLGGIPKGRILQYYGSAGSGKSLMSLLAIREAQKEPDTKQLYIDAEQTADPSWMRRLGLDLNRVIILNGFKASNGRELFELILGVPKENAKTHAYDGKKKEGLLDKIASKEININLIVLDSLGTIVPPGEDVSTVGKAEMTRMARFLTPTFKKLSLEVYKANIPFIVINHKRDGMDPYGPNHSFSGGNSYSHSLSANIYFEAIQRKDAIILDEKENKIGHTLRASVEKSKFGPQKKCELKVNFTLGVVGINEEIATLALDYDIVTKPSSMSYEYNSEKWVGYEKFTTAISENDALATELLQKIKEARDFKLYGTNMPNVESSVESSGEDSITKSKKQKKVKI